MPTTNVNQEPKSHGPVWYFLLEYSLSELRTGEKLEDEITAGLLFQIIRNLGIQQECLKKIEETLTGFAKEAMVQFNQRSLEFPVYIRLFCEKKIIEDVNSTKPLLHFIARPTMEPTPIHHRPDTEMNGGWGFFLVERGGDSPAGSPVVLHNSVDLYLYKEG